MNIYITLDYELFFGNQSGTVEKCIIEPTQTLLDIVNPYEIKFTCFVDAGYLLALKKQYNKFPQLKKDYDKITKQIKFLSENGHGIELHVHPHWEDSYYNGKQWIFKTDRYRLASFTEGEVLDIVTRYTHILKQITEKDPVAYRAGGWSAQPFSFIKKALVENNIRIDSTVYPNGYYNSDNQVFDFRGVEQYKTEYNFSDDLTVEDINGDFKEIPISSLKVSPTFFWNFALAKLSKNEKHMAYGDGTAIAMAKNEIFRLMTASSYSVVSVDGYKAKLISKALKKYERNTSDNGNFVMIGHPKAFTPYSLKKLEKFISSTYKEHNYTIFK